MEGNLNRGAAVLLDTKEETVIFHPNMAQLYDKSIHSLVGSLNAEQQRTEAADVLRGLLEKVVLTPMPDKDRLCVDLLGDLAGILSISTQADRSRIERNLSWYQPKQQVTLVAGAGFEPATFRL